MKVFLCEKPSQAADIARHVGARSRRDGAWVGQDVAVTWAIGHLIQQAPPETYKPELSAWRLEALPVLPEQWVMQVKSSTAEQFKAVCRWIGQARELVIATDADREGEVIARELLLHTGYRGSIKRLWLSAMDDASVKKALNKIQPGEKTYPMYLAGLGRARADWLAGMNFTMGMTAGFGTGGARGVIHCGRVQTPVLALVVRRERAIKNFVPKTHFVLESAFDLATQAGSKAVVSMGWKPKSGLLDKDGHVVNRNAISDVANKVRGQRGKVESVESTDERELAPLLYSLGSLQKDASARFGLKAQQVLDAAQSLYEKHKATTYPRTDCEYLPSSMFAEANAVLTAMGEIDPGLNVHGLIDEAIAAVGSGRSGRVFNDRHITAHHAIIPTTNKHVDLKALSRIEAVVYEMIKRRYLAQFLGDFLYRKTTISASCCDEQFAVTGKTPTRQGWKRVIQDVPKDKSSDKDDAATLPDAKAGQMCTNVLCNVVARKTEPPKRYTEGTLIAAMESIDREIEDERLKAVMKNKEKAGIGTDATRASIIEALFKREYLGNEKKFVVPTPRANVLIETVEQVIPELADPVLTAMWEEKLNLIEQGKGNLEEFERDLGSWISGKLGEISTKAKTTPRSASIPGATPSQIMGSARAVSGHVSESAGHACLECGKPMRQRSGTRGLFWGCSGYPACKCTLPDVDGKPGARSQGAVASTSTALTNSGDKPAKYICYACGKPMRERQSQRGVFLGCTGFPECRQTAQIEQAATEGAAAPQSRFTAPRSLRS